MSKSDFAVFQEMSDKNMDISCFPTFVSAQSNKQGGAIAMGVPNPVFTQFCLNPDKYVPVLYLANREQFFKLKNDDQS